ncbi:putative ankyrin repeat protein RF_0381 [Nasonia vitripennis]|uniref:Uncharacterized protein n=1 Tax=Nasonia vitripennis TaxID=7425 RepID=A0A7M7H9A9_NASVI|nr:putative ankyrin repeat protein RF_0381 [Nasonia vitripennis]
MRTWFEFTFSCQQERIHIIRLKIWRKDRKDVKKFLRILARFLTMEEMCTIIEDAVIVRDEEIARYSIEVYPRRSTLRLAEAMSEEIILLLLKSKVDWSQPSGFWRIPTIFAAVYYKRLDILERLAKLVVNPEASPIWLCSTLCQATRYNDVQYVQLLVKAVIKAKCLDRVGVTAMKFAIERNNLSVVQMLLDMGVDADFRDYYNNNLLELACASNSEILRMILKRIEYPLTSRPVLLEKAAGASYLNSRRNVKLLLNKEVSINSPTTNGRYPIEAAIREHNDDTLDLLLQQGADVELITVDDKGILHSAVEFGSVLAVRAILEKTSDVNKRDSNGDTALRCVHQ